MLIEGCNSCASLAGLVLCFIACFILLVIAPLLMVFAVVSHDGASSHVSSDAEFDRPAAVTANVFST